MKYLSRTLGLNYHTCPRFAYLSGLQTHLFIYIRLITLFEGIEFVQVCVVVVEVAISDIVLYKIINKSKPEEDLLP